MHKIGSHLSEEHPLIYRLSSWRSGALSHPMLSPVGSVKVIYNNKVTAIFSCVGGKTADFPPMIEVYHRIKY